MDLLDRAHRLMAQDEARLAPLAVSEESVDVGAADRRHLDAEEGISGSDGGLGDVLDLDAARARIDERFHRGKSIRLRSRPGALVRFNPWRTR